MSFKPKPRLIFLPWVLWIIAALMFGSLFLLLGHYGLFIGQVMGLISSSLGLSCCLLRGAKQPIASAAALVMFWLSLGLLLASFVAAAIYQSTATFEWAGALLCSCASFALATNSRMAPSAWFFWLAGNVLLAYVAYGSQLHGVMALNLIFIVININGIYHWARIGLGNTETVKQSH